MKIHNKRIQLKRKDCGKIEEIADFSSINPYKTKKILEEEGGSLEQCSCFVFWWYSKLFDAFSVTPVF
jgi:hypothetical protein